MLLSHTATATYLQSSLTVTRSRHHMPGRRPPPAEPHLPHLLVGFRFQAWIFSYLPIAGARHCPSSPDRAPEPSGHQTHRERRFQPASRRCE
jgi:hypothetical protein